MEMLKKFFPYSFGAADVKGLVIKILVYLVASAVLGFILGLIPCWVVWLAVLSACTALWAGSWQSWIT